MNVNLISGYIGTAEKWRELLTYELENNIDNLEEYLEIDEINFLLSLWQDIVKQPIYEMPEAQIKLPPSYIDLWQSGVLFFFDKFFALYLMYAKDVKEKYPNIKDLATFYAPNDWRVLKNYSDRQDKKEMLEIIEYLSEHFDEDSFDEYNKVDDYFNYEKLDGFLSLPALNKDSLLNYYVIADGELEVNGALAFLHSDICFLDGENEVSIYSLSEATFIRYKSFAELFIRGFVFFYDEDYPMTLTNLLQHKEQYHMIFDSSVCYT
ncbi:hypothetical protein [Psychrobacter sp. I-STPA6b]|uniref:hypothetical protein n=1 Tax=Psychrobacter sp. I-STPA6b TaxID=2585718 RepID=UPI001D0CCCD7|nr:hypothetical protein [Psychrobacter sp. I-STPA6b]